MPRTRLRRCAAFLLAAVGLLLAAACDSGTPSPTAVAVAPTTTLAATGAAPSDTAIPATATVTAPLLPTFTLVAPTATAVAAATVAPTDTATVIDTVAPTDTTAATVTLPAATRTATRLPPIRKTATATVPLAASATLGAVAAPTGETGTPVLASATPGGNPPTPADTPTVAAMLTPGRTPLSGADLQVERVLPGKGRIALTFDAGSTSGDVPAILAALSRYNAHITFFVTGQWANDNPEQVRAMLAAGDEVANHSFTHPSFPKLTDAEMISELAKADAAIQAAGGRSSKPYWRPPFGDETGHVLNVARDQGYRSIYWTWDSLDSIGKPKSKDFIVQRVTGAAVPLDGAVILQHVAAATSVAALPEILTNLYGRGLRVVTITELLAP